ncbi:ArsR/SmtB family transcription factor [Sphingomonas faeni]|uniref:ArsR/SmtB family transcription factor n=1 Tax=Sphingomonas faeni TaxID=185950 RepID=UPI0020C7E67E|nr:metalloregulator ArsR/SmtB family transcription factor [Sphingomonas faeni]MCP8892157.1 metalloregulator ArsR/SmtB family transcription factor [Sphingomonas faeni]
MTAIYQSRERANAAADRLKTYAQPQRLMILSRLLDGEQIVAELERSTGIVQPALSQQLAELRKADLVVMRRAAKQVFYRLADDDVTLCVRAIEAMFGSGEAVSAALERVTGPPKASPAIAPKPSVAAMFARVG